jgi:hypothetical protein
MLKVTLDIFSGRPNPEWIIAGDEARAILETVASTPEVIEHADASSLGLGYRGMKLSLVSDDLHHQLRLPASFRVLPRTGRATEIADRILQTASKAQHAQNLHALENEPFRRALREAIAKPAFAPQRPIVVDLDWLQKLLKIIEQWIEWMRKGGCKHEEIAFDPTFWNDPAHVSLNNCYNFASNRRTDTFAQPGRATGHMYTSIDCDHVRAGAISDGAVVAPPCPPDSQAPRYLVALVIAPSWPDFHWYRKCCEGFWAHKPGGTPARNYDNSGNIIYDPEHCDRGAYTVFCTYMYTQKKMVVN